MAKRRFAIWLGIGLLLASSYLILSSVPVSTMAVRALFTAAGYPAEIRWGVIDVRNGPEIQARDVSMRLPGEMRVQTPLLIVRLDLVGWLSGGRAVTTLRLDTPAFFPQKPSTVLPMDVLEWYSAFFFMAKGFQNRPDITISGGSIHWAGFTVSMEEMEARPPDENGTAAAIIVGFVSSDKSGSENKQMRFRVESAATLTSASPPSVRIQIHAEKIPLNWFLIRPDIHNPAGSASLQVEISGIFGHPIQISGDLFAETASFDLVHQGVTQAYRMERISISADAKMTDSEFFLSDLHVRIPESELHLSGHVGRKLEGCRPFRLDITAPDMPISVFSRLFPGALAPSWVTEVLMPNLTDGRVGIERFGISGEMGLSACRRHKTEAPEWNMLLHLRGMTWKTPLFSLPLQQVSATVSVSEKALDISEFSAILLNSKIQTGRYHIPDFDRKFARIDLQSRVDVTGARNILWESLPPGWDILSETIRKTSRLSGIADLRLSADSGWDPFFLTIRSGEVRLSNLALSHPDFPLPVKKVDGIIRKDDSESLQYTGKGIWGSFPFTVSGAANLKERQLSASLEMQADIPDLAAIIGSDWPQIRGASGRIDCRTNITGGPASWVFDGSLALHEMTVHTPDFSITPLNDVNRINFRVSTHPEGVFHADKIVFGFGNSQAVLSAVYNHRSRKWPHAVIRSPGFSLDMLGLRRKPAMPPVSGNIRGELTLQEKGAGLPGRLRGELHASEIEGWTDRVGPSFRMKEAILRFTGEQAVIEKLDLEVGENRFLIHGDLTGWEHISGQVSIHCPHLRIAGLSPIPVPVETQPSDKAGESLRNNLSDIQAHVDIDEIETGIMKIGPAHTEIRIQKDNIFWDDGRIRLDSGYARIKGSHRLHPIPQWFLATYIRVNDWPLPENLVAMDSGKPRATGNLSLDGFFSGNGRDTEQLFRNLYGTGQFTIDNGTLYHSSILIRILDWMSLQKLIRSPQAVRPGDRFIFDRIAGNFTIGNGILHLDDITITSPVLNAGAQVRLDLTDRTLRADIGVKPFGTIDALVGRIPVVGHVLTGDDQSITTYHFEAAGTWPGIETRYKPFEKIGSGVFGYIERILMTPKRLMDKVFSSSSDSLIGDKTENEIRFEQYSLDASHQNPATPLNEP